MIYIDDCVKATMQFLSADKDKLKREVYNLAGVSFCPEQLVVEVQKLIPGLTVDYKPCPVRQAIAESWPRSLDDTYAKQEWGWKYDITMYELAKKILENIDDDYKKGRTLNLDHRGITGMKGDISELGFAGYRTARNTRI